MSESRLIQQVWTYALQHKLLVGGERLVVAVSGGPDSLCLLDVLHRLAAGHALTLTVAHVNHGLRPEATAEAEFVRAEAAKRDLPCVVEMVDTPARAALEKEGIEAAARQLRYQALTRAAQHAAATHVAVAHTADDQAETVLMRLLRGSGLAGLRGIRPKVEIGDWGLELGLEPISKPRALTLIRPLLGTTRAEVEAYCLERGLAPRQDATNADTHYFRNWVRHEALPFLEGKNPNLRSTLARTAEVLAGEHTLAEAAIDVAWRKAVRGRKPARGQVTLRREVWQALDGPTRRGLLRRAVGALRGAVRDLDFAPLDAAARFGEPAQDGRYCELPGGLRFKAAGPWMILGESGALAAKIEGPRVNAAGKLLDGWRLETEWLQDHAWETLPLTGAAEWEAYVDAGRMTGPLEVQARRIGQTFQPLGLGGHRQKISDYMVNVKVPKAQRAGWPVVVCGQDVVWLAGLRLDERFRVRPETKAVLRLTFVKEKGGRA